MFFFLVLSCSKPQKTVSGAVKEQFCTLDTDWGRCLEQQVSLSATLPDMLMQHPVLAAPMGEDSVQNYITVGERQIIALSSARNSCTKEFLVQGRLKKISLGGPAGTKRSYSNYYLSNTQFLCK